MTRLQILLLAIALLLSAPLALRATRAAEAETVSGRDLVVFAQERSRASYTFDQATDRALRAARLPRPAPEADLEEIVGTLNEAGFRITAIGGDRDVFRIEGAGN